MNYAFTTVDEFEFSLSLSLSLKFPRKVRVMIIASAPEGYRGSKINQRGKQRESGGGEGGEGITGATTVRVTLTRFRSYRVGASGNHISLTTDGGCEGPEGSVIKKL